MKLVQLVEKLEDIFEVYIGFEIFHGGEEPDTYGNFFLIFRVSSSNPNLHGMTIVSDENVPFEHITPTVHYNRLITVPLFALNRLKDNNQRLTLIHHLVTKKLANEQDIKLVGFDYQRGVSLRTIRYKNPDHLMENTVANLIKMARDSNQLNNWWRV